MVMELTAWEDGGIGALVVAIIWAIYSWWKKGQAK